MSKQAVLSEIERDHRFALRMLAGLARRMHGLIHDVEAYALHSGLQRSHRLSAARPDVRRLRTFRGADRFTPGQQSHDCVRLSLTPEYFSRVLHELEGHGLIEIDRRDIRIPNLQRLTAFQLAAA